MHLPADLRSDFHQKLINFLNPKGKILLECFSKEQINHNSGGPKNDKLLYDLNEIKQDFANYNIEQLEQTKIYLNEGPLHQGNASVIRLIAQKN